MPWVEHPSDGFFVGTQAFGKGYSRHTATAKSGNEGRLCSHISGYGNEALARKRRTW